MHELKSANENTDSLANRTYFRLADMVLSGELPDGSPIMERRLADQLAVSRTPVREAINRLEAEGLLERKAGRILVRKVDLKEFLEVLHIRKLLECDAARSAAERISANVLDMLHGQTQEMMRKGAITATEHQAMDEAFHSAIATASGNKLLAETITKLRRRTAMFDHDRLPARLEPGCQEHMEIIAALKAGDGTAAADAMARHIDNVRSSILAHWGIA